MRLTLTDLTENSIYTTCTKELGVYEHIYYNP